LLIYLYSGLTQQVRIFSQYIVFDDAILLWILHYLLLY